MGVTFFNVDVTLFLRAAAFCWKTADRVYGEFFFFFFFFFVVLLCEVEAKQVVNGQQGPAIDERRCEAV